MDGFISLTKEAPELKILRCMIEKQKHGQKSKRKMTLRSSKAHLCYKKYRTEWSSIRSRPENYKKLKKKLKMTQVNGKIHNARDLEEYC